MDDSPVTIRKRDERVFDIIIYGASGYSGTLIFKWFLENYPPNRTSEHGITWAIAGRDKFKLETMKTKLFDEEKKSTDATKRKRQWEELDVPVFVAEVSSPESLVTLTAKTKLLLNCVGPFLLYGEEVVKACLQTHTDYIDITGEGGFIYAMEKKYHTEAQEKGILILPACAFDSIPANALYYFSRSKLGDIDPKLMCIMEGTLKIKNQKVSHGTWATFIEGVTNRPSKEGGRRQRKRFLPNRPKYSTYHATWLPPFPTADAFINRRSYTLDEAKKQSTTPSFSHFEYEEYVSVGGFISLIMTVFALLFFVIFSKLDFGKKILLKMNTEGPPTETKAGGWSLTMITKVFPATPKKPSTTLITEASSGLPPYLFSAVSSGMAAICIIKNRNELPRQGGVLPPITAIGERLMNTLVETSTLKLAVLSK